MKNEEPATIACIGWGSLVWSPRSLPCRGVWHDDGPLLPVEFARESGGPAKQTNLISLVICPGVPRVRTLWTLLDAPDLGNATHALGVREYEEADEAWIAKYIGFWNRATGESRGMEAGVIAAWAESQGLDGVVWTSLPCGFRSSREAMPDADAVLACLKKLGETHRPGAEEYVRKAPAQIDTPYRRRIEHELGWTH